MTDESKTDEPNRERSEGAAQPGSPQDRRATASVLVRLPGLIAIALYMVILAGTVILGVATHHFPRVYLAFPVFFIAAGLGLLMLFRWAWALALGAVTLMTAVFVYRFSMEHAIPLLVQGLLNLVFFLYLVRTEVRDSLR